MLTFILTINNRSSIKDTIEAFKSTPVIFCYKKVNVEKKITITHDYNENCISIKAINAFITCRSSF